MVDRISAPSPAHTLDTKLVSAKSVYLWSWAMLVRHTLLVQLPRRNKTNALKYIEIILPQTNLMVSCSTAQDPAGLYRTQRETPKVTTKPYKALPPPWSLIEPGQMPRKGNRLLTVNTARPLKEGAL